MKNIIAPAQKDEARAPAPTVPGPKVNTHDHSDARHDCTQVEKDFATIRAEAAIHGITVHRVANKSGALSYLIGKWSWSRSCDTLAEAMKLIERMGGAR
jgi:hypothetical protein